MIWRLLFSAMLAIWLAGCGEPPPPEEDLPPPLPALWELASADGTVEGWLFGTIHALPDGAKWETPLLTEKIDQADMLMVEIAALEDSAAISRVFARLARTDGLLPLSQRLPPGERAALESLLDQSRYVDGDFTATESWAAALMLAQSMRGGDPANGVDRALLRRFREKPVTELEGAERQLGIFDSLPEREQRDLLRAVIREGPDSAQGSQELARSWLTGDMQQIARESNTGILADPELRAALLDSRNQDWAAQIAQLLPRSPPVLVAVGGAHMAGPQGLPELLGKKGFTVTRIQ